MKLPIKPVSQRNPAWANKKLGTSTVSTIGNFGCALTCLAMLSTYFKHETDPAKLNDDLVRAKGFHNGSYVIWGALSQVYPDIQMDWNNYIDCPDVPAPLGKIDALLDKKLPVLVKVDFSPQAGLQEHWVLIIGKEGDYLINDPWTGETYFFTAKYGDPVKQIYKIVAYKGPVTYEPTDSDKIFELQTKLNSLNEELARTRVEINGLTDIIKNQERDNTDLTVQINQARQERDNAIVDKKTAEAKTVELEGSIDTIQKENEGLKEAVKSLTEHGIESLSGWQLIVKGLVKLICPRHPGNYR